MDLSRCRRFFDCRMGGGSIRFGIVRAAAENDPVQAATAEEHFVDHEVHVRKGNGTRLIPRDGILGGPSHQFLDEGAAGLFGGAHDPCHHLRTEIPVPGVELDEFFASLVIRMGKLDGLVNRSFCIIVVKLFLPDGSSWAWDLSASGRCRW